MVDLTCRFLANRTLERAIVGEQFVDLVGEVFTDAYTGDGELVLNAGVTGKGTRVSASLSETVAPVLDDYFLVNGQVSYLKSTYRTYMRGGLTRWERNDLGLCAHQVL